MASFKLGAHDLASPAMAHSLHTAGVQLRFSVDLTRAADRALHVLAHFCTGVSAGSGTVAAVDGGPVPTDVELRARAVVLSCSQRSPWGGVAFRTGARFGTPRI